MRERIPSVLYVRGNAYLKAGRGAEAVQAFQRLQDLKSIIFIDPVMPLAKLGLARAYVMADDKARGRVAYQDFLAVVEGRRSECSPATRGQSGVREAAVVRSCRG